MLSFLHSRIYDCTIIILYIFFFLLPFLPLSLHIVITLPILWLFKPQNFGYFREFFYFFFAYFIVITLPLLKWLLQLNYVFYLILFAYFLYCYHYSYHSSNCYYCLNLNILPSVLYCLLYSYHSPFWNLLLHLNHIIYLFLFASFSLATSIIITLSILWLFEPQNFGYFRDFFTFCIASFVVIALLHLNYIFYLSLFAYFLYCYLYSYHSWSNIVNVWPPKIWYFRVFFLYCLLYSYHSPIIEMITTS